MKEIQKVMQFDFINAITTAVGIITLNIVIIVPIVFFITPVYATGFLTLPIFLIGPLQIFESKYGFNKLYGILPVHRKSIIRGRFALIATLFYSLQFIAMLMTVLAIHVNLSALLSPESSTLLQSLQPSYDAKLLPFYLVIYSIVAMFLCCVFSYMEITGQLFGRENELKILTCSITILVVLFICFLKLTEKGVLPYLDPPKLPQNIFEAIRSIMISNIITAAFCITCSEISAHIVSKREL